MEEDDEGKRLIGCHVRGRTGADVWFLLSCSSLNPHLAAATLRCAPGRRDVTSGRGYRCCVWSEVRNVH